MYENVITISIKMNEERKVTCGSLVLHVIRFLISQLWMFNIYAVLRENFMRLNQFRA
jgi:hypothetical protein